MVKAEFDLSLKSVSRFAAELAEPFLNHDDPSETPPFDLKISMSTSNTHIYTGRRQLRYNVVKDRLVAICPDRSPTMSASRPTQGLPVPPGAGCGVSEDSDDDVAYVQLIFLSQRSSLMLLLPGD